MYSHNNRYISPYQYFNIFVAAIIIFACLCFINCSKSQATRELPASTLDIANRAQYVVVGRIISSESKWDDQKAFIFTYTTFSTDQYIKGDGLGDEVTLRIVGGQVGDQILQVPDRPEFNEGQEVVLFLNAKNKYGFYNLSSLMNGVLRIQTDEITGKKILITPTTGIEIFKKNTTKSISQLTRDGILLEDFIHSLKQAIE